MQTFLRYVILRHEGIDAPHFDLMFETAPGGLLSTWRSDAWPIDQPTPLLRLADHRRDYLSYEGPLTGNRGSVRRIEAGSFIIRDTPPNQITIELIGARGGSVLEFAVDLVRAEPHWIATVMSCY